ncbi:MAG: adenylosuccinate lyase, partial [Verrucomicrobiae bacterium]|nr:adenylosuccinate lyase [Verrucomicrobiae bacterium]
RLATDDRIPLTESQLEAIFEDEARLAGMAKHQVEELANRVESISAMYPDASVYRPGRIL